MTHFGTISGNAHKLANDELSAMFAKAMSGKCDIDWQRKSALETVKGMSTYRHVVIVPYTGGGAWHTNAMDGTHLDFCDDY